MGDRFYAHIPGLIVDGSRTVLTDPLCRVRDLIGKGGGHQYLRQQRVRVQGNRTNQIVELAL